MCQSNRNPQTSLSGRKHEVIGAKFMPQDAIEFRQLCRLENKTPSEKLREIVLEHLKNQKVPAAMPAVTEKTRPNYPNFTPPSFTTFSNSMDWYKNAYMVNNLLGMAILGAGIFLNGKGK